MNNPFPEFSAELLKAVNALPPLKNKKELKQILTAVVRRLQDNQVAEMTRLGEEAKECHKNFAKAVEEHMRGRSLKESIVTSVSDYYEYDHRLSVRINESKLPKAVLALKERAKALEAQELKTRKEIYDQYGHRKSADKIVDELLAASALGEQPELFAKLEAIVRKSK